MADKSPRTLGIDLGPLTFGFDIGIASVGWCVLGPNHIIDLGVRCFDKAETADKGEPLNLARRTARLMRRRLRRRAWRLIKLSRLLKREGVIHDERLLRSSPEISPWQLRVAGLDRKLNADEWARVLYHICKHRGFHWLSKAEERKAESDAGEGGRVKKGLSNTKRLMEEKRYRSAAEMILAEFPDTQRNKQGGYEKALSRILLGEELALLFARQRELGNAHATPSLEASILGNGNRKSGLFWEQKPPLSGDDLLKMLGRCTFEKDEYRAPKASYTAERHVWLTRLNNLRIIVDGVTRPLNDAERQVALPLPYQQASDLTYKQLKSALVKKGLIPEESKFAGLSYPTSQDDGKSKDPEIQRLIKLPAWQELRKTLTAAGLEPEWRNISCQPELLDQISWVLSVHKDGDAIEQALRELPLPGSAALIDALSGISFDKFHNLSLKALRKIVPHMQAGLRYDEACKQAGYHHSQLFVTGEGQNKYLPPFYADRKKDGRMVFDDKEDIPRNPVVLRALNQARKVLNALVRRYGSPAAVHIEMARDLSRPMDERKKIEKLQEEYRTHNQKARDDFAAEFKIQAKGREFEKYLLYREQQGKCAYSLEPLELDRVLHDPGYAEIDHILPYSRSYDDSKNNKALVLTRENRNKGNCTPFEYLDGANNSARWRNFVTWVESNKSFRLAKRNRLLRRNFGKDEAQDFMERNLNDTRYICRFFKNYVERHLLFAEGGDKRCVVLSGQLTAFLRTRWGLSKVRGESDRHHAMDAAVIAACSHSLVKRLSDYSRRRELEASSQVLDMETGEIRDPILLAKLEQHFPKPWEHFREELLIRLNTDDPNLLKSETARFNYPQELQEALRPLFVSRAPQRRNGGAAHKDTIYAQPERLKKKGSVIEKVPLNILKLADFGEAGREAETCKLVDWHRNKKLYEAIRVRLIAHDGKADKAFPSDQPLRKPDRNGNPTGPVVRTVTRIIDKLSGIPIRGGIAKNDSMLRVDVFQHRKDKKYHLVPVYVHHAVTNPLPNRAIVAHKEESEWIQITDEDFDFIFSLYPNDFVKVTLKIEVLSGYYAGCDRSTGALSLWAHDRNSAIGKNGLLRGIGAKTAVKIEKFHVDILGNRYPAPSEKRRGLA